MKWNVAICDDEINMQKKLCDYFQDFSDENSDTFQIFCFSSGEELIAAMPSDTHLLLLDIAMDGMSGIETAKLLRQKYPDLCLVFITSMTQHALDGYSVHAYGFLPKPLTYEIFEYQLKDCLHYLAVHQGGILTLQSNTDIDLIHTREIVYIEIYRHKATIVFPTHRKDYIISLSDLENQLDGYGFYRCYKSYLVNFRQISSIESDRLLLKNGDYIPLSRYRRQKFLTEFASFMGGQI